MKIAWPIIVILSFSGCAPLSNLFASHNEKKSWEGEPPVDLAVTRLLSENKKIVITVFLNCSSPFSDDYFRYWHTDRKEWTKACISMKQPTVEGQLLKKFGENRNFKLVERASLDKVYDELALSAKPEISEETRLTIGRLTNATQLYIVNFTRTESGPTAYDNYDEKLIDIESGGLLAVQWKSRPYKP